jgi:hypothetical protein
MTIYAVYLTATGELVAQITAPSHPRFNGFAWDGTIHTSKELPASGEPATQTWDKVSKAWVDDPAKINDIMRDTIKTAAENKKMGVATPGGYKKTEYAAKRQEVIEWDKLGIVPTVAMAAFLALNPKVAALRFEWAIADAAELGDTVDKAIERFRAGILQAIKNGETPAKIGAREQRVMRDMKAAATKAQKAAVTAAFTAA